MIKPWISTLSVAALTSVLAVDADAQTARPKPNDVRIESLLYNGSGCPVGSVTSRVTPQADGVELSFSDLFASVGRGVAITGSRRFCQMVVGMHVPRGWSYAVAAIDYGGSVTLARRVGATQKSTLYFSGQLAQTELQSSFDGPVDRDYVLREEVPAQSLVWSSCTEARDMNIHMQVKVDNRRNRRAPGRLSIDNVTKVSFAWRRCP